MYINKPNTLIPEQKPFKLKQFYRTGIWIYYIQSIVILDNDYEIGYVTTSYRRLLVNSHIN